MNEGPPKCYNRPFCNFEIWTEESKAHSDKLGNSMNQGIPFSLVISIWLVAPSHFPADSRYF